MWEPFIQHAVTVAYLCDPVHHRGVRVPPVRAGLPVPEAQARWVQADRAGSTSCRASRCSCRCTTRTFVAERIIKAACKIDYPREKLEIQVLDDSTDHSADIARKACEEMAALGHPDHLHPPHNRTGYKAGALAEGLKVAKRRLTSPSSTPTSSRRPTCSTTWSTTSPTTRSAWSRSAGTTSTATPAC